MNPKSEISFIKSFLFTAAGIGSLLLLLLLLIDPYDNLPLSPPAERAPVASNQRYSYPTLARSSNFDSAIISSSVLRLLNPQRLNPLLESRFVNLSMNSATAWEQQQILRLFLRHHRQPKYVIVGIDSFWCQPEKPAPRLSHYSFPERLYDADPWNNHHYLFEFIALEIAARQAGYLLGLRSTSFRRDGHAAWNENGPAYDLPAARMRLYGRPEPMPPKPAVIPPAVSRELQLRWTFPDIVALERLMGEVPAKTRKLIVFVPLHHHQVGPPGSALFLQMARCKDHVVDLARRLGNIDVLDMMIRSPLTLKDANYWDPFHFRDEVAAEIEIVLARFLNYRTIERPIARALVRAAD
jgi:hypothetical protein